MRAEPPNHALHRTREGRRGCDRRVTSGVEAVTPFCALSAGVPHPTGRRCGPVRWALSSHV